MKKNLIIMIVTIFLMFNLINPLFAVDQKQLPDVCASASETMRRYFAFQNEMISLLAQGSLGEKMYGVDKSGMGPFTQKLITLRKDEDGKHFLYQGTVFQHILETVKTGPEKFLSMQSTLTVMLLLVVKSTAGSVISLPTLLAQQFPIVREWRALQNLDSRIFNTAYNLSTKVKLMSEISDISPVVEILSRYNDIFEFTDLGGTLNYAEIFIALTELNSKVKRYFVNPLKKQADGTVLKGTLNLKFNSDFFALLSSEYEGVFFGFSCDASIMNMAGILTGSFKDNIVNGRSKSLDTIKQANQKLKTLKFAVSKKARLKGKSRFTKEEKTLLRSLYGIDVERMTEDNGNRWKNHIKFKADVSEIAAGMKEIGDFVKNFKESISDATSHCVNPVYVQQCKDKNLTVKDCPQEKIFLKQICKKEDEFSLQKLSDLCSKENRDNNILLCSDYNNSHALQNFSSGWDILKEETLGFWDNANKALVTTTERTQLEKIYAALEGLDGDSDMNLKNIIGKKGEEGTLVQTLGELCEKQCSNKGNKGCWASKQYIYSDLVY